MSFAVFIFVLNFIIIWEYLFRWVLGWLHLQLARTVRYLVVLLGCRLVWNLQMQAMHISYVPLHHR